MCPFGSRKSQGPGTKGTKWGPGVRRTGLQCRLAPLDNIVRSPTLSLWLWQAREGFGWMLWCGRFGEDNVPGTMCQGLPGCKGVAVFSAPWTSHQTSHRNTRQHRPGSHSSCQCPRGCLAPDRKPRGFVPFFAGLLVQAYTVNWCIKTEDVRPAVPETMCTISSTSSHRCNGAHFKQQMKK